MRKINAVVSQEVWGQFPGTTAANGDYYNVQHPRFKKVSLHWGAVSIERTFTVMGTLKKYSRRRRGRG